MNEPRGPSDNIGAATIEDTAEAARIDALADLHGRYVADLRRLDELGEAIIAAHLTATVDTLEARLIAAGRLADAPNRNLTAAIASGLRERLGGRAAEVARAQLAAASGEAASAWAAILAILTTTG